MGLAVIAPLYVLLKVPAYATYGAVGTVVVLFVACGWLAVSVRSSLNPDDSLRSLLPLVTALVLIAAFVPCMYTIFPPAPRGEVRLSAPGDHGIVHVAGPSSTTWLTVNGRYSSTGVGMANYFLNVSHADTVAQVDGALHPNAGRVPPERHVLSARGPGDYDIRLENISSAVAPPLVVGLSAKPFSTVLLIMLFAALGVGVLAVDTMVARRGIEPAVAASLLLPMVAAIYFQRSPASNTLPQDLLAAGLVGLIGGGVGGEVLARIARSVIPK
jgi:hypothetical protein